MNDSLPPERGAVKTATPTIENPTDRLQPETLEDFLERSVAHDPNANVEDAKAVVRACYRYRLGHVVAATCHLWVLKATPTWTPAGLLHERALAAWLLRGLLDAEICSPHGDSGQTLASKDPEIPGSPNTCENWWCDFPAGKVAP